MKPKHQRLLLALIAVVALIGAGLIAASALREEASYFYTPTTLAAADVEQRYSHLLIEKYLMAVDEGWIFRQALLYRGAIQEEDERAGARALLFRHQPAVQPGVVARQLQRIGIRLPPHDGDIVGRGFARRFGEAHLIGK